MNRTSNRGTGVGLIGLVATLLVLAACASAGASVPPSPNASAMAEPSAMASETAMAAPSGSAMVEPSGAAMAEPSGSGMAEPSAMAEPSGSAMAEPSAMASAAAPVSTGMFHSVDGKAAGTVALFHQPDGTFAITFEDFTIASIADTHVILVTNTDVTKDADIDKAAIVDLGPLTGTSGMQDFAVPASANAMTFHTVVLWDTAMAHAIAAAPLK